MVRRVGAVFVAWVALTGPAYARTQLVLPDGSTPQPEQTWVNKAKVKTPALRIPFAHSGCPLYPAGYADACAELQPAPAIYMGADITGGEERFLLLREVGHFVAAKTSPVERIRFRAYMHDSNPDWYGQDPGILELSTPEERFADAFALCALRKHLVPNSLDNSGRWMGAGNGYSLSRYGYLPTEFQHRKVCKLIRSMG
jgi:hypothetical protein